MPLKPGRSKKTREENIEEAAHSAKASGKFGNQKGSIKKLMPSILAAAYKKSGESKTPPKRKK